MKNTKKTLNQNKKTIKGEKRGGLFGSYTPPRMDPTTPEVAIDGAICQTQLTNRDGSQARKGIKCQQDSLCLNTSSGSIQETVKPYTSWGENDILNRYKGTCQPANNEKQLLSRTMNAVTNTVVGASSSVSRSGDLAKMCGWMPSIQNTGEGIFNKNIWRNLKRNMCILATIPSNQLETLIKDQGTRNDKDNLLKIMEKHGVNLNVTEFDSNVKMGGKKNKSNKKNNKKNKTTKNKKK